MSAATQDINTPKKLATLENLPVADGAKIYAGTLVAVNTDGYAAPAADTAGLRVVGRANVQVDNTSGSDGDLFIEVERGVFGYANDSDAVTEAEVGKVVFVKDD